MEDFLKEDDQMTIARMAEEIAVLKGEAEESESKRRKDLRDQWDTAVAIGVAAGLTAPPDPETVSEDYELPTEWCGKSSDLIRAIVGERDALRAEIAALKKDLEIARADRNRAILDTRNGLAPVVAVAEAANQRRKDQADDNGSPLSLRSIKEAETEMDGALTDLEEVQL